MMPFSKSIQPCGMTSMLSVLRRSPLPELVVPDQKRRDFNKGSVALKRALALPGRRGAGVQKFHAFMISNFRKKSDDDYDALMRKWGYYDIHLGFQKQDTR